MKKVFSILLLASLLFPASPAIAQASDSGSLPNIGALFFDQEKNIVYVEAVLPGGATERAGLSRGDLLLSLEGRPIVTSADVATLLVGRKKGDVLACTFARGPKYDVPDDSIDVYQTSKLTRMLRSCTIEQGEIRVDQFDGQAQVRFGEMIHEYKSRKIRMFNEAGSEFFENAGPSYLQQGKERFAPQVLWKQDVLGEKAARYPECLELYPPITAERRLGQIAIGSLVGSLLCFLSVPVVRGQDGLPLVMVFTSFSGLAVAGVAGILALTEPKKGIVAATEVVEEYNQQLWKEVAVKR